MTASPYDLVIGLDRSDKKADLCLRNPATGERRAVVIDTAPEALWEWLAELRQQHPAARVGLCLEQPAVHLIPFLEAYAWITLHPINPITLQKYREAFVTSRAKDDTKDAEYLADLLLNHHAQLPVWAPEDSATRSLQQLVGHRRAVVDERTGLTNRLIALLKQYYPQALVLCGEDLWRPLATAFLLKWPSLSAVQKAKPATLKTFYYLHGSRSTKPMPARTSTHKSPQKNEPRFEARAELYRTCGVDLTQVPGIQSGTALVLLAELGPDFAGRFPTAKHFGSWLGLCPDNRITGGKIMSSSTRDVKSRAATALRLAAQGLNKAQNYFGDLYRRWKARLGTPKAITAMAHKLARILWHLFKYREAFNPEVFKKEEEKMQRKRLARLQNTAAALGLKLVPTQ
jgi:transposase